MRDLADLPDEALLEAYAAGDPAAAKVILSRFARPIYALARRLLQDAVEAEDVVQEAMFRLWQQGGGWQSGPASPAAWLHRVAANLALDRLRRRRSGANGGGAGLDEIEEPEDEAVSVEASLIETDRAAALEAALAELPERQRVAVVLRHIEGWNNPEIALALDVGVEAVESLTARGKRRLTELLAPRRDELGYAK